MFSTANLLDSSIVFILMSTMFLMAHRSATRSLYYDWSRLRYSRWFSGIIGAPPRMTYIFHQPSDSTLCVVRLRGVVFYRSCMLYSRTSHVYSESVCVYRMSVVWSIWSEYTRLSLLLLYNVDVSNSNSTSQYYLYRACVSTRVYYCWHLVYMSKYCYASVTTESISDDWWLPLTRSPVVSLIGLYHLV